MVLHLMDAEVNVWACVCSWGWRDDHYTCNKCRQNFLILIEIISKGNMTTSRICIFVTLELAWTWLLITSVCMHVSFIVTHLHGENTNKPINKKPREPPYPSPTSPTSHDDVTKWKHYPCYWPFMRGIHRSRWIPHTKARDEELWCFFLSAPE